MTTASRRRSRSSGPVLDALGERVEGLRRFVELTEPYLPPERLDSARRIVGRTSERLALSGAHTVVALAGATGSGKSSIFNALAGADYSPVGLRRPTTGAAYAASWGPDPADDLLDWLGIDRRYGQGGESTRSGLILVDLPDFDSVEPGHRVEAERLLSLTDLIVWVLDPQKYADKLLHRQYLSAFGHHRDITVVALNQADRLTPAERDACLADLSRLLDADGLGGVPTLATSTVGGPGLGGLVTLLERAVNARLAARQRLSADVAATAADLALLVSTPRAEVVDRAVAADLYAALGSAAGVPLVVHATQRSYVYRSVRHVGWPVTRWIRRFRADPLNRLRLGGPVRRDPQQPVGATSIGPSAPAAQAALSLALRSVGDRCGAGLPEPWPDAVLAAARSHAADLPDALDVAVARTDLGMSRTPGWWRAIGLLQWLFVLVSIAGLGWLALRYALFALALPEPPAPAIGRIPLFTLLFLGGAGAGLLLAAVVRPVVVFASRRRARRVASRLADAVRQVGDTLVLAPVSELGRRYADARAAWSDTQR